MLNFFIIIVPIIFASAAQLLLKRGLLSFGSLNFSLANLFDLVFRVLQNGYLLGGAALYGASFFLYLFALSRFQLNVVYPTFVSAGIVIISLSSWFFLKEALSWPQILGIISIIFGIFLLAVKG